MNISARSPALDRAIAAIHAGADMRAVCARVERRARIRQLVLEYTADSTGFLAWLWQARRYVGEGPGPCWTYEEAIRELTGRVHVERRYCREGDWKARPDLAAAQWDRLVVARALRRGARQTARRAA